MNVVIYQIRDEESDLWHKQGPTAGSWVINPEDASYWVHECGCNTVIETIKKWNQMGRGCHHALRRPVAVKLQPFHAINILRDLFAVRDLADFMDSIREGEERGWESEAVARWGDACARAQILLSRYT